MKDKMINEMSSEPEGVKELFDKVRESNPWVDEAIELERERKVRNRERMREYRKTYKKRKGKKND